MVGLDDALWLEPRLRKLVEVRIAQLNGAPESLVRHAREALELAEALVLAADHRSIPEARNKAANHFNPAELAQLTFVCIAAAAWDRLELATGARRP